VEATVGASRFATGANAPLSNLQLFVGIRPVVSQPGLELGLLSYYVARAFGRGRGQALLDLQLLEQCVSYLRTERFDDLIVRKCGMQGRLVHHRDVKHPQPYRIEYGVCHGESGGCPVLTSYPSTKCPMEFWSKRHLPLPPFLLVRHICCRLRLLLPEYCHIECCHRQARATRTQPTGRRSGKLAVQRRGCALSNAFSKLNVCRAANCMVNWPCNVADAH